MIDKDKDFVREYNASIKHGEKAEKVTLPKGISIVAKVRRTVVEDENEKKPAAKKRKGIIFNEEDNAEYES
jgi:hypothetical protein